MSKEVLRLKLAAEKEEARLKLLDEKEELRLRLLDEQERKTSALQKLNQGLLLAGSIVGGLGVLAGAGVAAYNYTKPYHAGAKAYITGIPVAPPLPTQAQLDFFAAKRYIAPPPGITASALTKIGITDHTGFSLAPKAPLQPQPYQLILANATPRGLTTAEMDLAGIASDQRYKYIIPPAQTFTRTQLDTFGFPYHQTYPYTIPEPPPNPTPAQLAAFPPPRVLTAYDLNLAGIPVGEHLPYLIPGAPTFLGSTDLPMYPVGTGQRPSENVIRTQAALGNERYARRIETARIESINQIAAKRLIEDDGETLDETLRRLKKK